MGCWLSIVKAITELKPSDMERLEGFGKRKAEIVYNAIPI
jgi:hypothetical protein